MRMKTGAFVLAGVLFGAAALLPAVSEGRGGGPGRSGRCGQTECRQLSENCPQDRQRLQDGSCGNESCPQNSRGCRNRGGNQAGGAQGGTGTTSNQ
jgi:hypothetical protein